MAVAYDLTGSCAGTAPADGEVVPEAVLDAVLLAVWFGTLVDVAPVIRGCVVGGGGAHVVSWAAPRSQRHGGRAGWRR